MASVDKVTQCLGTLQALDSHQRWDDLVHSLHYGEVFSAMSDELAEAVRVRIADDCRMRPSRSECWDIASEVASPLPSEEDAYIEMNHFRTKYGVFARKKGFFPSGNPIMERGAPTEWSHPLLARLVLDMGGWEACCHRGEEGVFRAQFRNAYQAIAKRWRGMVRDAIAHNRRPPELFPDYTPFQIRISLTRELEGEKPKLLPRSEREEDEVRDMFKNLTLQLNPDPERFKDKYGVYPIGSVLTQIMEGERFLPGDERK